MAAWSPVEQGSELRRLGEAGVLGRLRLQGVDEEVELDVGRTLAPQGAVVVEAGHPLRPAGPRATASRKADDARRARCRAARRAGGRLGIGQALSRVGVSSPYAPEADVAHAGVDRLRPPRGRPVAQAVGVGAQVGAALDHLAPDPELRLGRVVARLEVAAAGVLRGAARPIRRRRGGGWSTSRRSTPRRCRPCRRARTRWPGSCRRARFGGSRSRRCCATGSRARPRCWPSACRSGRASSPQVYAVPSRPPRAAYSHSASVGSAAPAQARTPRRPRGRRAPRDGRGRLSIELFGPCGCFQQAPGFQRHHWLRWRRSTGPRVGVKTIEPGCRFSGGASG